MEKSKSVTLKEAGPTYALTLDEARLRQAPFTIERNGKPVAAVVPVDEYQEFIAWREQAYRPPTPAEGATTPRNEAWAALERERAAFLRLKDQRLRTHHGQFVAILNGEVIDADEDDRALTRRVYAKHGYIPIYIDRVAKESPVRRILSPKKVVP
jgi:prevent-host-death family protein